MEIIFCRTKKLLVIMLVILLISIIIGPISKAVTFEKEGKYKYTGWLLVTYKTEDAARRGSIFYKPSGILYRGSKIKVEKVNGDILKIGNEKYIKYSDDFKLIELKVTDIKISETNLTIKLEDKEVTKELKVTVKPDNATNKNVKWESSNPAVATVDRGIVIAKSPGEAKIKAITEDGGKTAECKVVVKQKATGIELNKYTATINVGEKLTLKPTIKPDNASNKNVTWKTSNKNIAKVDNGVVTAIGTEKGKNQSEVKITATTANGEHSAICVVTVKYIPVTSVSLPENEEIYKNNTKKLTPTIKPSDATEKEVKWETSDKNIVTVSEDGTITAKKAGSAIITATVGEKTAECKVTVKVPATGITIKPASAEMYEGDELTLVPTITPSDATNKNVKWTSSDETIAKVNKGVVTAIKEGTVTITAITANEKYKATCKVTVKDGYNYEYTVNKGKSNEKTYTYKIAVTKQKLDSVLKTIDQKDIYQNNGWYSWGSYGNKYVTNEKCYRIALCHLDMLRSDDVEKNIKHGYNTNKRESYSEYYQYIGVDDVKVNITQIKNYINNKIPVSFHTYSQTGAQHWVAVIGYKGSADSDDINDLLFISCTEGVLCINGEKDVRGKHTNKNIKIFK